MKRGGFHKSSKFQTFSPWFKTSENLHSLLISSNNTEAQFRILFFLSLGHLTTFFFYFRGNFCHFAEVNVFWYYGWSLLKPHSALSYPAEPSIFLRSARTSYNQPTGFLEWVQKHRWCTLRKECSTPTSQGLSSSIFQSLRICEG